MMKLAALLANAVVFQQDLPGAAAVPGPPLGPLLCSAMAGAAWPLLDLLTYGPAVLMNSAEAGKDLGEPYADGI
ncbi:hypothetical protein ACIBEA_41150 [Streptomyces sp. NPDC051555]|uniref:hypothetical protein n=1 Tax=Streptomyces sp. NPDC051555 TaxID=3365657 RepID=UPI00379858F4